VVLEKDGEESWTDRVRNEMVSHRVKEERNIIRAIKRRKANWIGHILRRNCFKNHVTEGKIQRGRRRCKQLLDDLRQTIRYSKLKEKALDRTLVRVRLGRGYGPDVRRTKWWWWWWWWWRRQHTYPYTLSPWLTYVHTRFIFKSYSYHVYKHLETVSLRSAHFGDFTQRRMVVPYRRFGTAYWSHLQQSWPLYAA
jgi:hypothetical protein